MPSCSRLSGFVITLAVLSSAAAVATAQAPPSVSTTQPQAVAPGGSTKVVLRGGNLAGASQVWSSFPATASLAADVPNNGKDAASSTWQFDVPADVPVGVHGIRVAGPGGVSGLKLVLVDDLPSVASVGKNTTRETPQDITLPVAIDGSVASLNYQYFRFDAKAGQSVSIEVVARRLGSALDPFIRLFNPQGREVAWSDDEAGLRGDARIHHTFEADGKYTLELRDIRYQGGGGHFYRLRIGDFPIVSVPYPLGAARGQQSAVTFVGPDATAVAPALVTLASNETEEAVNVGAKIINGRSSALALLRVAQSAATAEVEPNNSKEQATAAPLGNTLSGRIDEPTDVDVFKVAGKKGQKFTFRAITRRIGAPTSVYVRILNKDGGQVAAKEDFGVGDASFDYAFPADGDYFVAVEELHRRGGGQFGYLIETEPSAAGFDLSVTSNTVNVGAGSTSAVTVNVTRRGYNGAIQVAAEGLPEGIVSQPTVIGPGMKSVVLTLTSTSAGPQSQVIPVRVVGRAKIGDKEVASTASTEDAMKAGYNALPWAPQNLTRHVAVGVGPQPQIRVRPETPAATLVKGKSVAVKVVSERSDGFNEAITLAVTPDPKKGGLPGNVTAEVKPIAKDQNEIVVTFKATDKAPVGQFTVALNATIKQGKTTVTQAVPGITLTIQDPPK
ncbi:MAG: hypothetical protein ACYTGL_17545 [Planctomycetota bacterium]|jgi:hypothetical protein